MNTYSIQNRNKYWGGCSRAFNAFASWVLEKDFPKTEAEWRSGSAVKNSWNGDGAYVEYTVPEEGLNVWRGAAAKQESGVGGYMLDGSTEQIWVPANSVSASSPKPSPWNKNFE